MSRRTDVGVVFAFEEIGPDLIRAPLAVQRLFRWTGLRLSPAGWSALTVELRRALVVEGSKEIISNAVVASLASALPMREVSMIAATPGFELQPADELASALGLVTTPSPAQWLLLPGLTRFALNFLARNDRLLWRAIEELRPAIRDSLPGQRKPFRGLVASCELALDRAQPSFAPLVRLLQSDRILDGRGLLLARAAGLRAARRTHETLDVQSECVCGPVELDRAVQASRGCVLWQAHASTWGGEFFPAAALLAVTTAAIALADMIYEIQPGASLRGARIAEDAWRVGPAEEEGDEPTSFFRSARGAGHGA